MSQLGKLCGRVPARDMVPGDEAEFLHDTAMYNVGTHSVDVGSRGDWAQSNATKTAIGFRTECGMKLELEVSTEITFCLKKERARPIGFSI